MPVLSGSHLAKVEGTMQCACRASERPSDRPTHRTQGDDEGATHEKKFSSVKRHQPEAVARKRERKLKKKTNPGIHYVALVARLGRGLGHFDFVSGEARMWKAREGDQDLSFLIPPNAALASMKTTFSIPRTTKE